MKKTVGELNEKWNSINKFVNTAGLPAEESWDIADFFNEAKEILKRYKQSTEMLVKKLGKADPDKEGVYYIDGETDPETMLKYREEDAKLRAKEYEFKIKPIPVAKIRFTQPIEPIVLIDLDNFLIRREKK